MSLDPTVAHLKCSGSFGTRFKGGGDNDGYILEMCSGHSLVALYSAPNVFLSHFGALESLVLSFLFEYTNWSFY